MINRQRCWCNRLRKKGINLHPNRTYEITDPIQRVVSTRPSHTGGSSSCGLTLYRPRDLNIHRSEPARKSIKRPTVLLQVQVRVTATLCQTSQHCLECTKVSSYT